MRTTRLVLAMLVIATACSSGGGMQSASGNVRRGGSNYITNEEVLSAGGGIANAFDLINRIRPTMLRPRATSFGVNNESVTHPVVVYSDDVPIGTVDALRSIPVGHVYEVRYFTATDATQRWGTGHPSGAIQVITRK